MVTSPTPNPDSPSLRSPEALADGTRQTIYEPMDQCYVRRCPEFTVTARMDHITRLWAVCVQSSSTAWTSGTHRCPGCLLPCEALDWGEQLWNGQAVLLARADVGATAY